MEHTYFKFSLGNFECIAFHDYSEITSLKEVFSDIPPEELTSAMIQLEIPDAFEIGWNVLYLNANGKKVLIDCGVGSYEDCVFLQNLKSASITPGEIDYIVITHADGDHYRGLYDAEGEIVFHNAQIVLWQKAWELWTNPESREQMVDDVIQIYTKKGMEPEQLAEVARRRDSYGSVTLPEFKDRIILVDADEEFIPGFRLLDLTGHRGDHTGVEISSKGQTLLHVSDTLKHHIQAAYPYFYGEFDTYPEIIIPTNKKILKQAAETNALIFMAHYTFPGLVRVQAKDDVWEMKPIEA